jgi:archaellum component FlaC
MKKLITTSITTLALSLGVSSVMAADFSDDLDGVKSSIAAIEKQLDSMDVSYNKVEIDSGLNRTQELRALESQYKDLKTEFNNAYTAN